VAEAGLEDQVEIRLQDYRDSAGETFDAISSIGMFEHVGSSQMARYFETLHGLLRPHRAPAQPRHLQSGGIEDHERSFMGRYVFPDGELQDVGEVVLAMERAGFEIRDVESLREHYSRTLHAWVANLEAHWPAAVEKVGAARARVWRLYMAGSAVGFDDGGIGYPPGPRGGARGPAGPAACRPPATAGAAERSGPVPTGAGGREDGRRHHRQVRGWVQGDGRIGLGSLIESPRVQVLSQRSRAFFSGWWRDAASPPAHMSKRYFWNFVQSWSHCEHSSSWMK
jgi:hypothetical protein